MIVEKRRPLGYASAGIVFGKLVSHAPRAGRSAVRRQRREWHRRYHGIEGFCHLSHAKGIYVQGRRNSATLLSAPFGRIAERILAFVLR